MDVKITLPLLPLRDIVVFPSMVIPLFVGRDKSISALNEVMKKDKKIIHSMKWIQKNLDHTPWHPYEDPEDTRKWQLSFDSFWVDLYNSGGNNFYEMWKIV